MTSADVTALETRYSEVCAELAAMTDVNKGGKPDAGGGGDAVQHVAWRRSLLDELRTLREEIREAKKYADNDGSPVWELRS
jgi:hypothetical protein